MAFTETGVKATWKNPTVVPDSQKQNGGWYFNPSTGSVDHWFNNAPAATNNSQPQSQPQSNNQSAPTNNPSAVNFGNTTFDPVASAKQLNEFQVQQNQPAIQQLEASKQPLQDRYSSLLNQIKGNQQTATNRQTTATANELASRGITGGGVYDQNFADALNPITQQYNNLYTQSQAGENSDLSNIALQQAQLAAGNPTASINSALSIGGLQSQAQQTAAQQQYNQAVLANTQQQQTIQNALAQSQLGISQQNANTSSGQLGLANKTYNSQYGPLPIGVNSQAPTSGGGGGNGW